LKSTIKYLFLLVLACSFWACEKEVPNKRNGKIINYPSQIAPDSGYSFVDFGETRLAIYAPNNSREFDNFILGFPPTSGTASLMRGLIRHVADSLDALVISPTWIENSYQYSLMINSILALETIKEVPKYLVGYSAGGSDAFVEAQRLGDKIDGLVLLAAGRTTNSFLSSTSPPQVKICFCSGTVDFVYDSNVSLYQGLLKLGLDMKFIELEGFDHGQMFSTGYPNEIAECFSFVAK
jgi:hypothetical protein